MPTLTAERFHRIVVYVRRDVDLYNRLRALAYEHHITISALAGEYIRQGVEREETK